MMDKTVVITGGSGVLGSAIAAQWVKAGAKVAIIGRNPEKAENIAKDIGEKYPQGQIMGLGVDVLDKSALHQAKETINQVFGPCDILINGAGGNHPKGTTSVPFLQAEDIKNEEVFSFFDLDTDGIQYVFNLNYLGTVIPSQVFAKDMIGREGCSILNVSSMSAETPLTKVGTYSGAKAAIDNLTKWLSVHFSKVGIRVNAIAPGFFLTEQNRKLLTQEDGSLTERGQQIIAHTPMDRFGNPDDLWGAVEWLSSDSARFVTGIIVPIDGGFSAYSGV